MILGTHFPLFSLCSCSLPAHDRGGHSDSDSEQVHCKSCGVLKVFIVGKLFRRRRRKVGVKRAPWKMGERCKISHPSQHLQRRSAQLLSHLEEPSSQNSTGAHLGYEYERKRERERERERERVESERQTEKIVYYPYTIRMQLGYLL